MAEISRSALLSYSVKQIYSLINDIDAYPQYMDGCIGSEIIEQNEGFMKARLDLSKAGLQHSFTTKNVFHRAENNAPCRVEMELVEGPFKDFSGLWTVLPLGDSACKVSLDLKFTMASKVLGAASKKLFNSMANNLVDSVVKRAHQLYRNS
jgi:ribosome-associated toxin RatA of RatAB toxin-antitoxin module